MFRIRSSSGEPIYEQLVRQIKHAITSGALKPGDQLPTVRQLAADLVVNPNTVARAYRELETAGLLESNTRRGTLVKMSPPSMLSAERRRRLQPFLEQTIAEARLLGFEDAEILQQVKEAIRKFSSTGKRTS